MRYVVLRCAWHAVLGAVRWAPLPRCTSLQQAPSPPACSKTVFEFYALTDEQKRAQLEQLRLDIADYQEGEEVK